ncbi:MAG TPA: RNA methyltransferase [Candidatus Eisenbacteria bacterium]|nr:RNA methyltransferase [Candidatus Eisenbacteria bacterium]
MADLYVALVHHPVLDKNGAVVTTAVTNMDVHDIARLSRTYGVRGFYVCTPVPTLQRLVTRIIWHWETGPGAAYNETRKEALAVVRVVDELDAAMTDVERETGVLPRLVATSAREGTDRLSYGALRDEIRGDGPPVLLVFGTGWGLTKEVLDRCDALLEPVRGIGDYNHLSVRSAAAVILDRLRNGR